MTDNDPMIVQMPKPFFETKYWFPTVPWQSSVPSPLLIAFWMFAWATNSTLADTELTNGETETMGKKQIVQSDQWSQEIRPFLMQYCADCHSGPGAEADIDFDRYETDVLLPSERARWNQIRGMIKIGAMPPADYEPRPTVEMRQLVDEWIDRRINTVDCEVTRNPGRVTMRRLNNVEYDNSVRDLLAIDFSPSTVIGFPSDDVGDGFDNQGDILSLSELQLEKYIQAAGLIAEKALTPPDSLQKQSLEMPSLFLGDRRSAEFLSSEGSIQIKVRLQFSQATEQPVKGQITLDGEPVESLEITNDRETIRIDRELPAGWHEIAIHFVEDPEHQTKQRNRRIDIASISVQTPPVMTESYRRMLGDLTELSSDSDRQTIVEAARAHLRPLIRRAYRREPLEVDIERIMQVIQMGLQQNLNLQESVGLGLQAILISPHFLFRVEEDRLEGNPSATNELDLYALASRLSYFLWSSIPDDQLLDLAQSGQLAQTEVLNAQVLRMLEDPKAESLVQQFFGQYLGLGTLRDVSPDPNLFPQWNDRLRKAIQKETELFCMELIRQNMPISTLLSGEFTFVNPRLAEFYSIDFEGRDPSELFVEGPGFANAKDGKRDKEYAEEDRWIRVPAPSQRRGILTHASVLTLTSNPTTTSPVKRGKWIMETILGDPPPPAPPNVPALEETQAEHEELSLREQLALHRSNPSCASCHDVMDPLGLGFEHFDAIGRWRESDSGRPVDAGGQLADGRKFNGSVELIRLLEENQSQIYRFFAEKLLTYSLGRSLEPYDQCAVDRIMEQAALENYTIRSFVTGVVQSEPFLKRLSATEEAADL